MSSISPLADARIENLADRLHARDARQFRGILWHYLPRMLLARFTDRSGIEVNTPAEHTYLRDKLVALDRYKCQLAYSFCRALDARRVVEVGTSFGVSTLYLAAALRDNASGDGSTRTVIGTEIEPTKAAIARAHLLEGGLQDFAEVREGDALQTLQHIDGPVDFVLIDTWIPLALPVLRLLMPRLRRGAIVMCDNVEAFPREYHEYLEFVRNPANGLRSMLWPTKGGVELSVVNGR